MKKQILWATLLTFAVWVGLAMEARGAVRTERVTYVQGETRLQGHLAYDDGIEGKRPGILVVHEWWGLNAHAKRKAEDLARAGYIALALDMYGEGKSTEHPTEAKAWSSLVRENRSMAKARFLAAYEQLEGHPLTADSKIAAIGYCFGGYLVLSMTLEGIPLKGVVSFHGSLPGLRPESGQVQAKLLVCHGAEDPIVRPEQIRSFQENLRAAGADWQFITYGGAKHSFTDPGADRRGMGALGYSRSADQRSWRAMLDFFTEIFGKMKGSSHSRSKGGGLWLPESSIA
jgi:dienelactone hydrolase